MDAAPGPGNAEGYSSVTYRISVDIGGTFTDVVVADAEGKLEHQQGADDAPPRV